MFVSLGLSGSEVIFALLTKVVSFQMQVIIVRIEVGKFEKAIGFVPRICRTLALSLFKAGFYELLKGHIDRS